MQFLIKCIKLNIIILFKKYKTNSNIVSIIIKNFDY